MITLRYKTNEYFLDEDNPELVDYATKEHFVSYDKHCDESNKLSCLMLTTMSSKIQKGFKNVGV